MLHNKNNETTTSFNLAKSTNPSSQMTWSLLKPSFRPLGVPHMNLSHVSFSISWSLPKNPIWDPLGLLHMNPSYVSLNILSVLRIARSNYLLHWLTSKRTRLTLISDQVMEVVYTFHDRHDHCLAPSIGMGRLIVLHVITVSCFCSLPIYVKTK